LLTLLDAGTYMPGALPAEFIVLSKVSGINNARLRDFERIRESMRDPER
jgi:hypothetical protein